MEIQAAEISEILKQQIKDFDNRVEVRETGTVLSTGDGIARIHGLDNAAAGELLEFPHDLFGIVLNLEEDNVGAAIFGEAHLVTEGAEVRRLLTRADELDRDPQLVFHGKNHAPARGLSSFSR